MLTLIKVNNPLTKSFDGLMKNFFTEYPSTVNNTFREDVLHFPPVNIFETSAFYQLELAAPGFEKSDFKIGLEGGLLTISIEKKDIKTPESIIVVRREFGYKAFTRSFTIDEKIDTENINAKYENGILKLELPKKEIIKAGSKEINIQ